MKRFIQIGSVVAIIGGDAAAPHAMAKVEAAKAPAPFRSAFEEVATPTINYGPAKTADGLRISPLARRLIAERGLDVEAVASQAAAKGLRKIEEKDVTAFAPSAPVPAPMWSDIR